MWVRWTADAADDLERICDYIAQSRPESARRVAQSVVERIGTLETFPRLGHPGRVQGTREIAFPPLPFVAVYEISDSRDEVRVLRVPTWRTTMAGWVAPTHPERTGPSGHSPLRLRRPPLAKRVELRPEHANQKAADDAAQAKLEGPAILSPSGDLSAFDNVARRSGGGLGHERELHTPRIPEKPSRGVEGEVKTTAAR